MINTSPKFDTNYNNMKQYLAEIKSDLSELNTSYIIIFFEESESGFLLISHMIFSKLPGILQKDLISKVGNIYPTIKQIFKNCCDIIKTLDKTNTYKRTSESPYLSKNFRHLERRSKPVADETPVSTLENFATNAGKYNLLCRLCNIDGHKISYCTKYPNVLPRKARYRELNLSILCFSAKHKSEDCPGNLNKLPFQCEECKTRKHITPLCEPKTKRDNSATFSTAYTNLELREQIYILPIVGVTITRGKVTCKFNCLFDIGSQRSYFSKRVINKLGCSESDLAPVEFEIKRSWVLKLKIF